MFFTSKHNHEKIVCSNWKKKQTLPPNEPAPLVDNREPHCEDVVDAKTSQVKALTPKETPQPLLWLTHGGSTTAPNPPNTTAC